MIVATKPSRSTQKHLVQPMQPKSWLRYVQLTRRGRPRPLWRRRHSLSWKSTIFAGCSLLPFAYPTSKCTIPDIYKYKCAVLVVIARLRTALRQLKEEERKKEINKPHERRFQFTTLQTSDSFAKGTIRLRIISWSFLDVWNLEERQDND